MAAGQRFAELLRLLLEHEVAFVVVGGGAAVLHGAPITTFDLDVVVDTAPENRVRILAALDDLDAVYLDPAGRRLRPSAERLESLRLHLLETRLGRLDVLTEVGTGLRWDDVVARSVQMDLAGGRVRVLELEAVIETKEAAGRPKDRAALPVLRETLRLLRESDA